MESDSGMFGPVVKYLGHTISSDPGKDNIGHKIGSAWENWAKYKHILLDHEVPLSIRVRMLEATVRSRLTYSLQTRVAVRGLGG